MKTGHADVVIGFTKAKPKIIPICLFIVIVAQLHLHRAGW